MSGLLGREVRWIGEAVSLTPRLGAGPHALGPTFRRSVFFRAPITVIELDTCDEEAATPVVAEQ